MRTVIASLAGLGRRRAGWARLGWSGGGLVRRRAGQISRAWAGGERGSYMRPRQGLFSVTVTCSPRRLARWSYQAAKATTTTIALPATIRKAIAHLGRGWIAPDPACLNCTSAYTGGLVGPVA